MKAARPILVMATFLGVFCCSEALAYCAPDGTCYKFFYYAYQGDTFCERWNPYDENNIDVDAWDGTAIAPFTLLSAVTTGYNTWKSVESRLPTMAPALALPGSENSYVVVLDTTTWQLNGWGPRVAGVTGRDYYFDKTIVRGLTHLQSRPRDPAGGYPNGWAWGEGEAGKIDIISVVVHEIGHWWHLLDVYDFASCRTTTPTGNAVTMFAEVSIGETWMRDLHAYDVEGIRHLYDQSVLVAGSFAVHGGPDADTLLWEDATPGDPGGFYLTAATPVVVPMIPTSDTSTGEIRHIPRTTGTIATSTGLSPIPASTGTRSRTLGSRSRRPERRLACRLRARREFQLGYHFAELTRGQGLARSFSIGSPQPVERLATTSIGRLPQRSQAAVRTTPCLEVRLALASRTRISRRGESRCTTR